MNNLNEMHTYDLHFKAWEKTVQEIEQYLSVMNVDYTLVNDKFIFKGVKYYKALEIERLSVMNGSILFIDNESKSATVEYKFNKRIGFFSIDVISSVKKFVETMEKQNIIDSYFVSQDKIIVNKDDYEFIISPSSTKTKIVESSFFVNVILLILKTEYDDRFEVNFENDKDVFGSIKYSNKMLDVKNRIKDSKLLIQKKI